MKVHVNIYGHINRWMGTEIVRHFSFDHFDQAFIVHFTIRKRWHNHRADLEDFFRLWVEGSCILGLVYLVFHQQLIAIQYQVIVFCDGCHSFYYHLWHYQYQQTFWKFWNELIFDKKIYFQATCWWQCFLGYFMMLTIVKYWWQNHYMSEFSRIFVSDGSKSVTKRITKRICQTHPQHPSPTPM